MSYESLVQARWQRARIAHEAKRLIPTERGATSFIKNDAPLAMGATDGIDRLVMFGGGYPIKIGGAIVGGVGVSGGHYTQDMEVAKTGLEAAG